MSLHHLSSLYQEWEMLLDSLASGLMDDFTHVQDEFAAVQKVYNTTGIPEIFNKWLLYLNANEGDNIALNKSATLADKWREKGNQYFKVGDLQKSLKYYNLSLLSAPKIGASFSLALGNRSAVLVRMSKFKEALSDIELALSKGYPPDKINKLVERKQKCQDYIIGCAHRDNDISKQFRYLNIDHEILDLGKSPSPYDCLSKSLLPNKHSTIEGASECLHLEFSKSCGRFVVTKSDVKRGQVLFVEKPYAFVALPGPNGVLATVCENCCQFNNYPIPCSECAGSVYCSEKCREDGWITFHKWECNGTRKLLWPTIGIAHLALRVLLVAFKEKFGLKSDIPTAVSGKQILEEITRCNNAPSLGTGYHRVYNLVTNFDKMTPKDLLQYTLTSVMLTMYLKHHSDFFQSVDGVLGANSKTAETVVCCLLLRQLGQMVSSGHAICGVGEAEGGQELRQTRLATGIFPSASMMNHSCDSNILNNHYGCTLVVRASRDTPSGGEVFNCYGPSYKTTRGEIRRNLLKEQYLFDCQCSACISPQKDNFIDGFNSFKCPQCSNSMVLNSDIKSSKCSRCNSIIEHKQIQQTLKKGLELCQVAETENCSAIPELLDAYKIQADCLTEHNQYLQRLTDSLARRYANKGSYDDSISFLNKLIPTVKYQYGDNSMEVGHELQKLCDVLLMKLESISDRKSPQYRCLLEKLMTLNRNVLNIFYYAYGSWTSTYKEVKERQFYLSDLHAN